MPGGRKLNDRLYALPLQMATAAVVGGILLSGVWAYWWMKPTSTPKQTAKLYQFPTSA
jgi:hypothetical protein